MGLKATITALIDSNIRNKTPKVIKVEHANVEQAILDNLYITDTDTDVSQKFTQKPGGSTISYNLAVSKTAQGLAFNGYFQMPAGGAINNQQVLLWRTLVSGVANQFKCRSGFDYTFDITDHSLTNYKTKIIVNDVGVKLPFGGTAGMKYDVNFTIPSQS